MWWKCPEAGVWCAPVRGARTCSNSRLRTERLFGWVTKKNETAGSRPLATVPTAASDSGLGGMPLPDLCFTYNLPMRTEWYRTCAVHEILQAAPRGRRSVRAVQYNSYGMKTFMSPHPVAATQDGSGRALRRARGRVTGSLVWCVAHAKDKIELNIRHWQRRDSGKLLFFRRPSSDC